METPLTHRDAPGGLFIGTSKRLFALMNSAPAELLHLLVYAALQPSFGYAFWQLSCRRKPKKTPATMPASEYCVIKNKLFFEENATLPEKLGVSGENSSDRFGLLLSIKFG
jgi:hypothetical protein